MMKRNQSIPEFGLRLVLHRMQDHGWKVMENSFHRLGLKVEGGRRGPAPISISIPGGGQLDPASPMQAQQGYTRAHQSWLPTGANPAEALADAACDFRSGARQALQHQTLELPKSFRSKISSQ
jgi:hypothetical protein